MPRTEGTECGLWLTPHGEEKNPGPKGGHLTSQVKQNLWPTPRSGNPGSRKPGTGGKVLAEEVKMWPTPKTPTGGGQIERKTPGGGIRKLEDKVSQLEGRNTGSLNPTWVEWLMGFPIGWTDLNHSETQ